MEKYLELNKITFSLVRSQTAISKSNSPALPSISRSMGLDISGHTFMLVYSNLIWYEECTIMTGWDGMVEPFHELYREYIKLGSQTWEQHGQLERDGTSSTPMSALQPPEDWNQTGIALCHARRTCQRNDSRIKLAFILGTLLSVYRDFMLLQTALFYHTILEKVLAFVWALVCWFVTYRCLFPSIRLGVQQANGQRFAGPSSSWNHWVGIRSRFVGLFTFSKSYIRFFLSKELYSQTASLDGTTLV